MTKLSVFPAIAVHIFTCFGVVCSLLALLEASHGAFELAFIWLGIALIVDGVDGPLARAFSVKSRLPNVSGERLDLIIDFLNYVLLPAYILVQARLLPEWFGIAGASLILMSSLYHFADLTSKTSDHYFVGFPAVWNLVVFYFFALEVTPWTALVLVLIFVVLTFVPLKWSHPVRVERFRVLTISVTLIWAGAAVWTVMEGFPGTLVARWILFVSAIYFLSLCLLRTFFVAHSRRTN